MIEKGKAVKDVTPAQADCIDKFSKCGSLVAWLKENVKGKNSEYNVHILE